MRIDFLFIHEIITLTKAIGYLAMLLTTIGTWPQTIKCIKSKSTKDISLDMYTIVSTAIVLWTIYGFRKPDNIILLTQVFNGPANFIILGLKIKNYKKDKES